MSYFGGGYFGPYFDNEVTSTLGRHVRGRHRHIDTPEPVAEDQTALIVLMTGGRYG